MSKKSNVVSAKSPKPLDKSETMLPNTANPKKMSEVKNEIKINMIVMYQGLCNCISTIINSNSATIKSPHASSSTRSLTS